VLEQELMLVEKSKSGEVSRRSVLPVRFVPMVQKPGTR
jgi:protein-L-isoaspartate O-methyltransferase